MKVGRLKRAPSIYSSILGLISYTPPSFTPPCEPSDYCLAVVPRSGARSHLQRLKKLWAELLSWFVVCLYAWAFGCRVKGGSLANIITSSKNTNVIVITITVMVVAAIVTRSINVVTK